MREKPAGRARHGARCSAPDIGYIRIAAFGPDVADEIRSTQADELAKTGATSLIIDVRHTAEGAFDNGIAAARLFVKSGTLGDQGRTRRRRRARRRIDGDATGRRGRSTMPVTLLVTTGTSGAAELFAAALDGNKRADLVGEHTLGRAGLQKLVKLPDGRGLWLTYARYLTADGDVIQGKGLDPDVAVDEPDVEFGEPTPAKDPILDAGLERLKTNAPRNDARSP